MRFAFPVTDRFRGCIYGPTFPDTRTFRQAEFCAAEGYSVAFVSPCVTSDASVTGHIDTPTP